jgi:hypothetical protein
VELASRVRRRLRAGVGLSASGLLWFIGSRFAKTLAGMVAGGLLRVLFAPTIVQSTRCALIERCSVWALGLIGPTAVEVATVGAFPYTPLARRPSTSASWRCGWAVRFGLVRALLASSADRD